jgi:hypothetical protein
MRDMLAERPGEPRLLFFAMLVGAASFIAPAAQAPKDASATGAVMANLVASLFFLPLFLYAVAGVARMICRALGGDGGWYETRVVTFWALVVAIPVVVASRALQYLSNQLASVDGVMAEIWRGGAVTISLLLGLVTAYIWAAGLAEAHGFSSTTRTFLALAAILLLPFAVLYLMTGQA